MPALFISAHRIAQLYCRYSRPAEASPQEVCGNALIHIIVAGAIVSSVLNSIDSTREMAVTEPERTGGIKASLVSKALLLEGLS